MKRLLWILPLAVALPLGADDQPVPASDWAWSLSGIDRGATLVPAPRIPAYLNRVSPAGPDPVRIRSGPMVVTHIPYLPGEAILSATVEDRYDWLPTYGANGERDRPWLRIGSEWTFARPWVRPFVGIGATVPLVSATNGIASQDPAVQADSARGQIALYAGVRF